MPARPAMRAAGAVAAALLACIIVPALLPPFWVTLIGYVGVAAMVALGLVLLTGISGQTSFGQASFVGLGAYATALLSTGGHSPFLGLLAGLVLVGVVAWLLGLITARLSGHFLALCSVAWGISFFSLFGTLPALHGFNGIGNIPPIPFLADRRANLALIWIVLVALTVAAANLLDSRAGRAIRALNGARTMAESVGIDTVALSRSVFVLAALYAGVAGWLFAHFQRFINPTPFSLDASIDYLFMAIIGGIDRLGGAVVGAALVVVLRDQFNDWIPRLTGRAGDFELLVFSVVVILLLQRAPAGLLPFLDRFLPRSAPRRYPPALEAAETTVPHRQDGAELLRVESVTRLFGGLAANQDISFSVHAGEIVALIGPNGAGKTTLFNVISGILPPSAGHVRLFGGGPARMKPRRAAAAGLARTFQHTRLLGTRSVLENVAVGAHLGGRAGVMRAMLRLERGEERRLIGEAVRAARRVGLEDVLGTPAGDLPLGRQRVVEIARALCLRPRLLLLDEPAAGLRFAEKEHLATLLRQLRDEGIGVLLVEHDMDFVMNLAGRVVVMDFGQKIADGPPERVQTDPAVLEAYLGGIA